MQFSKRVSELARLHGVDPKDVLFAMLTTAGASTAEAFAVIYRPTVSTSAALATKASNYIGARPGLKRLIKYLDQERAATVNPDNSTSRKRGRPRKDTNEQPKEDRPQLDYTDKDALLQEYARIAERCEKESDRLSALNAIATLQRMKAEAKVDEEKRVHFYIPLTYERCDELLAYLDRFYADSASS